MINVYVLLENRKRRNDFGDVQMGARIILKWILNT
jgi:hypothetical protein